MRFFAGVLFTLGVIIIIGILVVYSGWYNVSAANRPSGFEQWLLGTTMDNSVEKHSEDITVPDLKLPDKINEGFAHYNAMCRGCHGAPGQEQTEMSKGLNPPAPDLSESAQDMTPQQLFWVTKNGVRMTGMPAWGITHPDDKIWSIVAFIEKLPGMTGVQYDSLKTHSRPMEEEEGE
jgi:mono/diheme cytochrome c family protein